MSIQSGTNPGAIISSGTTAPGSEPLFRVVTTAVPYQAVVGDFVLTTDSSVTTPVTPGDGDYFAVKNMGVLPVSVVGTVDGSTSYVIDASPLFPSVWFIWDATGSSWKIVSDYDPYSVFPVPPSIDIYLATTGSDANNGLTSLTPVLTLAGAYSKIPSNSTLPVIHVASGTYVWTPMPFTMTILGDGAGQPGDTGFTTVATGVSAAGTNSTNLTLAAPVAVNAYRGLTLEWRSGAANGHRLTIRDNTATVVTPVEVAGYPTTSIDPGVGSDFAILRPSVIFTTAASEVNSVVQIMDALSSSREYHPAAIVNVRLTMSSAAAKGVIASTCARFFGVELNPGSLALVDSNVDCGFISPEAAANAWAIRVGLSGYAQITNWIPWGISWPSAGNSDPSFLVDAGSVLRGVFVVGTFRPNEIAVNTESGTIEIHGGSALGDFNIFRTNWVQENQTVSLTCRSFLVSASYAVTRRMICDGGGSVLPVFIETGSVLYVFGNFTSQNSNASAMFISRNSQVLFRGGATISLVGNTIGMQVDQSRVIINNASATLQGITSGLLLSGGSTFLSETAAALTITGTVTAGSPAIDILENSNMLCESATVLVANGVGGGARVRQNSKLTLMNATFTLAASSSGSGVTCNGGSDCYFPGGAGNTITGLGAANFGVNCRGGGRVFFLNAPPATVTGPAGDLTVGPGAGETIASSLLATSFSALVAGPSAIARAS